MKNKIVIELSKNNRVRKVYSDVPLEIADAAVKNVSYYPSKIKLSRRTRFVYCFNMFCQRLHYIFNAIKTACSTEFGKADINRHQYVDAGQE